MSALLEVESLEVAYGPVRALHGVDLRVAEGGVTALLGANGAGKSSTLMAVAGCRRVAAGDIRFEGRPIRGLAPDAVARLGIGISPEGRRVFAALTVGETLRLAGAVLPRARREATIEAALGRFPVLRERWAQRAGLLSGGEQQMLAIARALMAGSRLLLLDEPSLGLAPMVIEQLFALLADLKADGQSILLVEQNVPRSLALADEAVVLASGRVAVAGPAARLAADGLAAGAGADAVLAAYLAA